MVDMLFIDFSTSYILTGPAGLVRGDRVVVMTSLVPQFWTIQLACIKMGWYMFNLVDKLYCMLL